MNTKIRIRSGSGLFCFILFFSFIVVLFGLRNNVSAAVYYISASGSDSNNGLSTTTTWAHHPWDGSAGATSASTVLVSGDQVLFKSGDTFTNAYVTADEGGATTPIITGSYGSGAKPILLAPVGANNHAILSNGKSNVTFQDLDLRGGDGNGAAVLMGTLSGAIIQRCSVSNDNGAGIYISTGGVSQSQILNNEIVTTAANATGVYINGASGITVRNNTIKNTNASKNNTSLIGVLAVTSSNQAIIDNNIIGTNNADGFNLGVSVANSTSVQSTNNSIVTNNSTSTGIYYLSADSGLITGNTILNTNPDKTNLALVGILLSSSNSGTVASNTIATSSINNYLQGVKILDSDSNQIYNNIISCAWNGLEYPDMAGVGIALMGSSETNKIYKNSLLQSQIQDSVSSGAGGNEYYYNVLENAHVNSIDFRGQSTASSSLVYNNTVIHHPSGSGGHGLDIQISGKRVVFENNLVQTDLTGLNMQSIAIAGPFTYVFTDYNLYHQLNGAILGSYSGLEYTDIGAWIASLTSDPLISGKDASSISDDPEFVSTSTRDYSLKYTSPAIDAGANIGLTSDYLGQAIYGAPDIGAFEYQPPYIIGTDQVNSSADIKIYMDGRYRYTSATSTSNPMDFAVTPAEGSFPIYSGTTTRPEWLNVSNIIWNTTDTYYKQWTASSSIATSTIYTIGDLLPDVQYTIAVDGLASSTLLSDNDGKITYEYSAGYSTHVFTVTDLTAPSALGMPTFGEISTSSIEIIKPDFLDTDEMDLSQWQVKRNNSIELGFNSTGTNSVVDSGLLPNSLYMYSVQFRDSALNLGEYGTSTDKYTLAPNPANFLTSSVEKTSIILSVDPFTNASSSLSGYLFSRAGKDSGWIQDNSWQDTGLVCNTLYTYSVKYRNGDGIETDTVSIMQSTSNCASSGSSGSSVRSPVVISPINSQVTPSTYLSLTDFIKLLITLDIIPQEKIAYAKTFLASTTTASLNNNLPFMKDLKFGQTDPDVKRLQEYLNSHNYIVSRTGAGSIGKETDFFGLKTKEALIRFQEVNFEAILRPVNFKKGTGMFGPSTRSFVNNLLTK